MAKENMSKSERDRRMEAVRKELDEMLGERKSGAARPQYRLTEEPVIETLGHDEAYEMVDSVTGESFLATLLAILRYKQKRYAVFHTPNDRGRYDILAFRLVKDDQGYDDLVDMDGPEEKAAISNYLQSMMARGAIDRMQQEKRM